MSLFGTKVVFLFLNFWSVGDRGSDDRRMMGDRFRGSDDSMPVAIPSPHVERGGEAA